MPATVLLRHHEPRLHTRSNGVNSLDELLKQSCPREYRGTETDLKYSSFGPRVFDDGSIYPSSSGLVRSAVEAWGRHSHLVLRPDDFWTQILAQMNFYMKKNGESLRDLFVSHSGKQDIVVLGDDWEQILERFQKELQERVKTPWLSDWVQGGFSTSSDIDALSNIIMMMGLMSTYFEYFADDICGIPSITLLGTKPDWERLLGKIKRLKDFGDEPAAYGERLRPIFSRMVSTFDKPNSTDTRGFWDQMVHAKVKHSAVCGKPPLQYTVSGWLLGLFYWNRPGSVNKQFAHGLDHTYNPGPLCYDGVHYGETFLEKLPVGYAIVRCSLPEYKGRPEAELQDRWLLAGSIGKRIVDEAPAGYTAAIENDDRSLSSFSSTVTNEKGNMKDKTASLSRIFCGLTCFGVSCDDRRHKVVKPRPARELMTSSGLTKSPEATASHSTIQPLSGWFLFSANQRCQDDDVDFEELEGPTVDAINSCSSVEHYQARY